MEKQKFINSLDTFLKDTEFTILIHGDFMNSPEGLSDDEKYISIFNRRDEEYLEGYMDWEYNEFDKNILKEYVKEIPNKQGSCGDELSGEYLRLGELILKYLKTNN
jgi:hypothetical protein